MARPRKDDDVPTPAPRRRPSPATPEAMENRLIGLAAELAEKQLRDGTASAQVITQFLRLGSVRENLERDKLKSENKLLQARVETLSKNVNSEELYKEAIAAFTSYRPSETQNDYID